VVANADLAETKGAEGEFGLLDAPESLGRDGLAVRNPAGKDAIAGLSQVGRFMWRLSRRMSALVSPASISGLRMPSSLAARIPGRKSPVSSALAPLRTVSKPRPLASSPSWPKRFCLQK